MKTLFPNLCCFQEFKRILYEVDLEVDLFFRVTLDICTFLKSSGLLHYENNISHKMLYVFQEFKGILDELKAS